MGSGGSGAGGGHSSGKTDWPKELKKTNHLLMHGVSDRTDFPTKDDDKSMMRALLDAWDVNPYATMTGFDPEDLLEQNQTTFDTFSQAVDDIEFNTIRDDAVTQAISEWDDNLADVDTQETAVKEFRNKVKAQRNRDLSTFMSSFGDISEVATSQMVIGAALIFNEHERQVSEFTQNLQLQNQKDRQAHVKDAIRVMLQAEFNLLQVKGSRTGMQGELNRARIVASSEFKETENEIDADAASWKLTIFQHGANLLASTSGGTVGSSKSVTGKPPKVNALGAFGGGVLGAWVGGILGGPGGAESGGAAGAQIGGGIF